MPSGEIRKIHLERYATIGTVGNLQHENIQIGSVGRTRWKGIRPTVHGGVVMNSSTTRTVVVARVVLVAVTP